MSNTRRSISSQVAIVLAAALVPTAASAQWHAVVGAQNRSEGVQVLAFLPNEIWIQQGDSITWTFNVDEIHTVTFLKAGQVRLPFSVGCPGFSSNPATFDGSTCVTTPPMAGGQTFTVAFPTPGNYKLVCLVHENMTATVHVLSPSEPLPHDQGFYDAEAADRQRDLLSSAGHAMDHGDTHDAHLVTAGTGTVSATAGGSDTLSVLRFLHDTITIRAGETIEWTNLDPITPHTITFGAEPQNPIPPSGNVTSDPDGALHATLNAPGDSAHSGFIIAAPQERIGLPQAPLGPTRFRVTFTHPGEYPYICALHDDLGMKGTVVVRP